MSFLIILPAPLTVINKMSVEMLFTQHLFDYVFWTSDLYWLLFCMSFPLKSALYQLKLSELK